MVTFFCFLFFNYTSVYFLKNMFTNVKMKTALPQHILQKYAKSEKYANFHFFFYKIHVFASKHISIKNQEII